MIKLKYLFLIFLLICAFDHLNAQKSIPSDLSTIKVDNLSDDQIKQLISKAASSGLTLEQLEAQALSRGMPASEIEKLKKRIESLQTGKQADQGMENGQDRTRKALKKKEMPPKKEDIFNNLKKQNITEEDSLKKRIFGFDLFNNENLTFEPSVNIPTPQNYQLGAGDEIIIDIWGASQASYKQVISPEGSINIPNLGPIALNGLTIEKASQKIIGRLSSIYAGLSGPNPNTFAQVSLGNIRSINITIIGEVSAPGNYTMSALSSVFNALYAAGGPSLNGSLRNIKIFRENKLINTLDIYDFLIKGNQKDNVRLQDQDVIMISPYNIRVEAKGEIKRPFLYEMKENETLKDLIDFCGGFTSKAYKQRLNIIRSADKEHKILDVPIDSFPKTTLQDGDLMQIDPILERFENRVEIQGAVYRPGPFQLTDGLTLKGLINKAEGLKGDAFLSRGLIYRVMDNFQIQSIPADISAIMKGTGEDIKLQKDDIVKIFSIFELQEEYSTKVEGEVLYPGKYPYIVNSTLEDMIALAGGFKQSASLSKIEIARRVMNSYADTSSSKIAEVFVFSVNKDLKLSDSASKFILKPFDIISVRQSPGYEIQSMVTIRGEVNFSGSYSIADKNERISDLIKRAGGITNDAYIKGARLERTITENRKERQEIIKQIETQSKDSIDIIETTNEQAQAIGINLEQILKHPHSQEDLTLQDKDILTIPKQLQTVRLSGSVLYPITARYDRTYKFRKYIALAGGFADISAPEKSYVIYANGTVDRTRQFLFFKFYPKIEPGSEIIVPSKPEDKNKLTKQESIAITTTIATGVAALTTAIVSIVRLTQ